MEDIKSYFEIVFLIFIILSSIFIGFKIMFLIVEIKRGKQKRFINTYTTDRSSALMSRDSINYNQDNKSIKSNIKPNINNMKQKKETDEKYEIIKYDNGDVYKGELKEGKRSGFGICIFEDKSRYEGLWKEDLMHSIGKYTYTDGSVYSGDFKFGVIEGVGMYTFPNKDIYKG
ncbi:MAG: MORN repeat-containing protein, partial [Paraclostridium sp.]